MIQEVTDIEFPDFGRKKLMRFNFSATAYEKQYTYLKKRTFFGSELKQHGEPKIFKIYYDMTIECVEDIDPLILGTIIKKRLLELKNKCQDVIIKS